MKQSTCTCTCTHTSIIACKVIHPMNIHPLSCMLPLWMQWLEEDLLGYLSDWEESVKKRKGFTAAQKKLMLLPDSTMEGIRTTGAIAP